MDCASIRKLLSFVEQEYNLLNQRGQETFDFGANEPTAMPRRPRIQLAEVPLHIVPRGINREPCFFAEGDYYC